VETREFAVTKSMSNRMPHVAKRRNYAVTDVSRAREITWLCSVGLDSAVDLGLPEVDDR